MCMSPLLHCNYASTRSSMYMLQSIVGTSHYQECLKFSGNTGNACDHQSLPGMTEIKGFIFPGLPEMHL